MSPKILSRATLWKKFRRDELTEAEVHSVVGALSVVPLALYPSAMLLESALIVSMDTSRTVYDGFYLALAVLLKSPLVTALMTASSTACAARLFPTTCVTS